MKNFLDFLSRFIASFCFVGFFPFASGTAGSFAALTVILVIFYQPYNFSLQDGLINYQVGGGYINPEYLIYLLPLISLSSYIIGVWASERYANILEDGDPKKVVIDEVAGMFTSVALIFIIFALLIEYYNPGIVLYLSLSLWYFLAVFFLFRIFDILKPYPANWIEKNMKGGTAIMLDDIVASLYTVATFFIIFFSLYFTGTLDELISTE